MKATLTLENSTTLTLDSDIVELIGRRIERTGKEMRTVVSEALRFGLTGLEKQDARPRFEVKPRALGIRHDIDLDHMNRLVDELEATEAARKLRR